MALKAESDHLKAYVEHGKDSKETKEAKEQANKASKVFVEKTGLPWPFKDYYRWLHIQLTIKKT